MTVTSDLGVMVVFKYPQTFIEMLKPILQGKNILKDWCSDMVEIKQ